MDNSNGSKPSLRVGLYLLDLSMSSEKSEQKLKDIRDERALLSAKYDFLGIREFIHNPSSAMYKMGDKKFFSVGASLKEEVCQLVGGPSNRELRMWFIRNNLKSSCTTGVEYWSCNICKCHTWCTQCKKCHPFRNISHKSYSLSGMCSILEMHSAAILIQKVWRRYRKKTKSQEEHWITVWGLSVPPDFPGKQ